MIYKRGDRYAVRVYSDGKQKWLGTRLTKIEAQRLEAEWTLRESDPSHLPFRSFAKEWLAAINVSDRTKRDYVTTSAHLVEYFGDTALCDITPRMVSSFVSQSSDKYAAVTTRKQVTRLRQMLSVAVEWGYIKKSPASGKLSLPKVKSKNVTPLSPEEARRLIESADPYWRPLFTVAITTGLRQAELFGLCWEDVDLEAATLTVRQTIYMGKLIPPKSAAGRRTIHLPSATVDALKAHRVVCPCTDLDLVFPAPWGRYMNTTTWAQKVMRPTALKAEMPHVRLHDLRHGYASLLIRSGNSPKLVQTMMGHGTIGVTYNVYGHLFPDEGKQAADRVAEFLQE